MRLSKTLRRFPPLAGKKPVISGFFWFQGWNDMYVDGALDNYSQNFLHLVDDLRKEFNVPRMPVIIGQTGNADNTRLHAAQEAPSNSPKHRGTIVYVPTRQFRYKAENSPNKTHGHHWFGHAGSYFEAGDAGKGNGRTDLWQKKQTLIEGTFGISGRFLDPRRILSMLEILEYVLLNPGGELDLDWVLSTRINLSAIERRAKSLSGEGPSKGVANRLGWPMRSSAST